jgi:flagellar biosynthetic protein FliR
MEVSEFLIQNGMINLLLPFVRIAAVLMSMFALSSNSVPGMIRLTLALAVTYVMASTIEPVKDVDLFTVRGFVLVGYQILIGLMIGFATQFISQIFVVAGQVVAMQTGLGFASLVDPVSGTNTPVVGQFFTVLSTILFFVLNGHLVLFKLIYLSFTTLPISLEGFFDIPFLEIVKFGSVMFQVALSLSISSICAMLLVNFTFGVMTRAAPQLNIFSMGFAVSMACGLIILSLVLSGFMIHYIDALNGVFGLACSVVNLECPVVFE